MKKTNYYDREIACLVAFLDSKNEFLEEKFKHIKFTDYEIRNCLAEGLLENRIVGYPNEHEGYMYMERAFTTPKGKNRIMNWMAENAGIFLISKNTLKCGFIPLGGDIRKCTLKEKMQVIKNISKHKDSFGNKPKLILVATFLLSNFTPYYKIKHYFKRIKL